MADMTGLVGGEHPPQVVRPPISAEELAATPDNQVVTLPAGPAASVPTVRMVFWTGRLSFYADGTVRPDLRRIDISGLTPGARIITVPGKAPRLDTRDIQEHYQALGWMRVDHILGKWPDRADWDVESYNEYWAPLWTAKGLGRLKEEGVLLSERALASVRVPGHLTKAMRPTYADNEQQRRHKQTVIDRARAGIQSYQAILRHVFLGEELPPDKCGTPDGSDFEDGAPDSEEPNTPPTRRRGRPRKNSEGTE